MSNAYARKLNDVAKFSLLQAILITVLLVSTPGKVDAQGSGGLFLTTYPSTTRPNTNFSGTPLTAGTVTTIDQINLDPTGRRDFYSVRATGFILAETTGTYTFETLSDDGVRLFVDETTVIDNYGLHAPTINIGTITLTAGTWYPIRLDHYESGGGQRLRLRWQPPGAAGFVYPPSSVLSESEPILAGGPPLNTQDDRIAFTITDDARRTLEAEMASNQRANRDARARHATAFRCRTRQDGETRAAPDANCDELRFGKQFQPLRLNGGLTASSQSAKLAGDFFGATNAPDGRRHIYFGDFNISRFEGGDVSAVFSGRYARERLTGDRLFGSFLALSLTQSNLRNVVDGNRTGYGLSAGVYLVDQFSETLTWDGYISVGVGQNNLDIQDGGDEIEGDYSTTSVLAGFALSGTRSYDSFDLRPELNLSLGRTNIGDVQVTGDSSAIVDAGEVTLARLSFRPDFVFNLNTARSRFDTKELWITPSLTCAYQETTFSDTDCGGGLAFEWSGSRDDGLLDVSFRLAREVLGGDARDTLSVRLESAF